MQKKKKRITRKRKKKQKKKDNAMLFLLVAVFIIFGGFLVVLFSTIDLLEESREATQYLVNTTFPFALEQDKLFFCSFDSDLEVCACSSTDKIRCMHTFALAHNHKLKGG